jgi:hypothetical protein
LRSLNFFSVRPRNAKSAATPKQSKKSLKGGGNRATGQTFDVSQTGLLARFDLGQGCQIFSWYNIPKWVKYTI